MSRWTYLLPRLAILGLISLALWASAEAITRSIVVGSIENRTGGKVDVAQLRCSIGNQKLYLKEIVLADPNDAGRNLLQADMAYLDFDANALWRRQLVITNGQTSRLMFGTPRSTAEAPANTFAEDTPPTKGVAATSTEKLGQAWLDSLILPDNKLSTIDELQTTQANQKIVAFWDQELKQIAQNVIAIKKSTGDLNELANQDQSSNNPLRRKWQGNSYVHLQNMETQNKNVSTQLASLREQLRSDIATIEQAQLVDAQKISHSITTLKLNGDQLSDLLLADMHAEFVGQSVDMFKWFQSVRPEIGQDFAPKSQRGINIPSKGTHARPGCWIKQLEINGEGRLLDQHFDFSGNAYNLSTEPELLDEPATFELHAQGKQHAAVACTINRLGAEPVDEIKITCPELNLGERTLGHKDSLQLTLGDSNKVSAEVNLKSIGDQITGTIKLRHSNTSLHVDRLSEFAGGKLAALQMNEGVTAIGDFESIITITGDQNKVAFESRSDLGNQFAVAINRTLEQRKGNSIQQQLDALQAVKNQAVGQLKERVESQFQRVQEAITSNQSRIANLETITKSDNSLRGLSDLRRIE